MSTEIIWNPCNSLSSAEHYFARFPADLYLAVNIVIKSPLATGSIEAIRSNHTDWDLMIIEQADKNLSLRDFRIRRPHSVFVRSQYPNVKCVLQIVCRPNEAWNEYDVGEADLAQYAMAEIVADYSNVPVEELEFVAQFRVIYKVNQQNAFVYLAGITAIGEEPTPPPPPTHSLTVDSSPIQGVPFTIKKVA